MSSAAAWDTTKAIKAMFSFGRISKYYYMKLQQSRSDLKLLHIIS